MIHCESSDGRNQSTLHTSFLSFNIDTQQMLSEGTRQPFIHQTFIEDLHASDNSLSLKNTVKWIPTHVTGSPPTACLT